MRHISFSCHSLGLILANIYSLVSHHTCRHMFPVGARGQVLTSSLPQLDTEQLWFVSPSIYRTFFSLTTHTSLLCAHLAAKMVSSSNSQGHLKGRFLQRMSHSPILSSDIDNTWQEDTVNPLQ